MATLSDIAINTLKKYGYTPTVETDSNDSSKVRLKFDLGLDRIGYDVHPTVYIGNQLVGIYMPLMTYKNNTDALWALYQCNKFNDNYQYVKAYLDVDKMKSWVEYYAHVGDDTIEEAIVIALGTMISNQEQIGAIIEAKQN